MWSNDELKCIACGLDWTNPLSYSNVPLLVDDGEDFISDFSYAEFVEFVNSEDTIDSIIDYVDIVQWNTFFRKVLMNDFDWFTPKTIPSNVPIFKNINFQRYTPHQGDVIQNYMLGSRAYLKIGSAPMAFNEFMIPSQFNVSAINIDLPEDFIIDGVIDSEGIFHAYDLIPYNDFIDNTCPLLHIERVDALNQMIGLFQKHEVPIKIVESFVSDGTELNVIAFDDSSLYRRY